MGTLKTFYLTEIIFTADELSRNPRHVFPRTWRPEAERIVPATRKTTAPSTTVGLRKNRRFPLTRSDAVVPTRLTSTPEIKTSVHHKKLENDKGRIEEVFEKSEKIHGLGRRCRQTGPLWRSWLLRFYNPQ